MKKIVIIELFSGILGLVPPRSRHLSVSNFFYFFSVIILIFHTSLIIIPTPPLLTFLSPSPPPRPVDNTTTTKNRPGGGVLVHVVHDVSDYITLIVCTKCNPLVPTYDLSPND